MANTTAVKKKKKAEFKLPHMFFLMLGIIMFMSIMTYVIPAGAYAKDAAGKILGDKFAFVGKQSPVNPWQALLLLLDGVSASGLLIGLMLMSGGAIGVTLETGAIDEMVNWSIYALKDKGAKVLIPCVFVIMGVLGAFGGGDQFVAFVPIGVVLAKKLRLDPIIAVATMLFSILIGFATGPTKTMNTQLMMNVPVYSGFIMRFIWMWVLIVIGTIYTTMYAIKIQKDPTKSAMGNTDWMKELDNIDENAIKEVKFNPRAAFVVFAFFAQYFVIVYFQTVKKQPQNLMPAVLITVCIINGLIYGLSFDRIGNAFAKGVGNIAFICLIIGMAKTMSLVMEQGKIVHTIVYFACVPLKSLNKGFASVGMAIVISFLDMVIPSASAKQAILIPIIKPISDALGLTGNVAVTAFQHGDGLTNIITPVLAWTAGACVIAGVPFEKWFKWSFPPVLFMLILSYVQLYFLGVTGWTGLGVI